MKKNIIVASNTAEMLPPVDNDTSEIVMLSVLIRASIDIAAKQRLVETEHELRRALLGVHLEAPEAASLAVVGASNSRSNPS
jgi:hypothetical protein